MIRKVHQAVMVVAVLVTFTSGCRSTKEYEELAKAGTAYYSAVDELLVARGNIRVDNTSEELLNLDGIRNITTQDYRDLSKIDVDQLSILQRIREHNKLLSDYFSLLSQLATSAAPEAAQASISNVVTNLATISKQLPLASNRDAAGSVTRLVVSGKIRGALRDELEQRKDTIQAELILQQELLNLLASQIEDDLKNIQTRQEQRLIINTIVDENPIGNQDSWATNRRKVLTMETTAKELRAASDTAKEFTQVFEDFVSGKLTPTRINIFLTDIESFLSVIEDLKQR